MLRTHHNTVRSVPGQFNLIVASATDSTQEQQHDTYCLSSRKCFDRYRSRNPEAQSSKSQEEWSGYHLRLRGAVLVLMPVIIASAQTGPGISLGQRTPLRDRGFGFSNHPKVGDLLMRRVSD
nr:hypothetical protein CFP56_76459 [Quercus suber]